MTAIVVGSRRVLISDLHNLTNPGETWDDVLKSPTAVAIAAHLKRGGSLYNAPRVRTNNAVISGRRRIAAHMLAGLAEVLVDIVECTDLEAEQERLAENLQRTQHSNKARWHMARDYRALCVRIAEEGGADPRKAARDAVRAIAERAGISEKTVRNRLALAGAPRGTSKRNQPPPPIDLFGAEVDQPWLAAVGAVHRAITAALSNATMAHRALRRVHADPAPNMSAGIESIEALSELLQGLRPSVICPECWAADYVDCPVCHQSGWLTAAERPSYSPDAWDYTEEDDDQ